MDWVSLIESRYIVPLGSFILGIVGTLVSTRLLNRRGVFTYCVTHTRMGISEDDELFEDLQEVKSQLGLDDSTFEQISAALTLDSTELRIESQGWIGDATYTIILIISRTGEGENIDDIYLARLER